MKEPNHMATAARAVMGRSARKQKLDPAVKLALSILPAAQVANGRFREANVANFTEAQQRHTVRSKETKTVRRETHIEKLVRLRILTPRQGQLCQWYSDQREIGYSTIGCTANYCGAGGGGFGASDLFARYKAQSNARSNYIMAREAVELRLLPLLEKVIIASEGLNRGRPMLLVTSDQFKAVIDQLEQGIGHLVTER